jgi:hypothetical protein
MSVVTLLNAVSANATGPVAGLGTPYGNLTLSVSTTGTVSAFSVVLQGSNDGVNFGAIGSAITSPTAGTSMGSGVLFQYFQAVLTGYSGTGTVTVELAYSLEATNSGGGGPGAVTSVFTRTGAVVASSGDYTVSQVTGAAPLASPALTGTPAAPTATALTDSTQIATTAYADSAVAVETSRAETAEALKLAKASNLSDVASAPVALTNLGIAGAASQLTPANYSIKAWNFAPFNIRSSDHTVTPASGTLNISLLEIPVACTVTNIIYGVVQAGTSLTSANNFCALFYGPAGATPYGLLSATADQTSNFEAAAGTIVTAALTAPQSVAAGTYYVGWYFKQSSGTIPVLAYGDTFLANLGLSSPYVSASANTGLSTAMPSTIGTQTAVTYVYWFGLS